MYQNPSEQIKTTRKILCFNAQGYYSNSDWLRTQYGPLLNIFPHPRRIADEDWISQEEVKKILDHVDIWLAQEVSLKLANLIEERFRLQSIRKLFKLNFWENDLPVTTDIFFNPDIFKPISFEEIPAHEKSFLKNCHKTLIVEFKDISLNQKLVVGSSHLEAGIFRIQEQIRLEQLARIVEKLKRFKNDKVLLGFDANDLEKRKNRLFTKIEEIISKSGFREIINGSKTYNYNSNELPFSWLGGALLGLGNSLDKVAIKNLNVIHTKIINPGSRVSDHNAILTEVEI